MFILINLLILYASPLVTIIYIAFYLEYFYFLNYCIKIYANWNRYYRISLEYVDFSELNTLEIWFEYCRALAFSRLYFLLLRKRNRFHNLLFSLIILILGIPFKIIRFFYILLSKNKGFKKGLLEMYFNIYYLNRDNKIEILNGKIYMNGFSIKSLLSASSLKNDSISNKYIYVKTIKGYCEKWCIVDSMRRNTIEFTLAQIMLKEDIRITIPHYTKQIGDFSIHCTSKVPTLENSQVSTNAMPSGIKSGSEEPGSIVSFGIKGYKKVGKGILIPEVELMSAIHDVDNVPFEKCPYIGEKDIELQEILLKYNNWDDMLGKKLLIDIRGGCYTNVLKNMSDDDIWNDLGGE